MLTPFARYWWILFILGFTLIGLGSFMFVDPDTGIIEIMRYLGFVFVGMGIFTALVTILAAYKHDWRLYVLAAAELTMGIVILVNDEWAERTFIQLMGFWSAMMGVYLVVNGIRKSKRSIIVILAGVISLAFAAFILLGTLSEESLVTLIALYAIILGLYMFTVSFKVRGYLKTHPPKQKEEAVDASEPSSSTSTESKETE